jgi:hypothetical protein
MHQLRQLSAIVTALLILPQWAASAAAQITVTPDGRAMAVPASMQGSSEVTILVRPSALAQPDCRSTRPEAGRTVVKFRFVSAVQQPVLLDASDDTAQATDDRHVVKHAPKSSRFLIYNVWELSGEASSIPALDVCLASLRAAVDAMQPLVTAVEEATQAAEKAALPLKETQAQIAGALEDIKAYQGFTSDGAAARIAALQQSLPGLRTKLQSEQEAAKAAATRLSKAKAELQKEETKNGGTADELETRADTLSDYITKKKVNRNYFTARVTRIGGLLWHDATKGIAYDLADHSNETVVGIMPMSRHPVLRYGDTVYSVLINVLASEFPFPFSLTATAHAGAVVNLAPLRPTFDAGDIKAGESAGPDQTFHVFLATRVYQDIFLPVSGTFLPNDFAEVTITTERPDEDGKPETVTILDKAKYPPFRALYRFNFTSGVAHTHLRSPSFTKIRTADDDPSTDEVKEDVFKVERHPGDRRVMPIFAFTVHPVPVDIQSPVGFWERLIPSPTIGFSFTDPVDNVFVGVTFEIVRNAQLFIGRHFGAIEELVTRNDISEEKDGTAPLTRKKRDSAFSFGISFNVNALAEIFK